MSRCNCKTLKGVQCKKSATAGSKTCSFHKNCKAPVTAKKVTKPKIVTKKTPSKVAKKSSPQWIKSKAWESPLPEWLKYDRDIGVKPMSPQNADPWWLRV